MCEAHAFVMEEGREKKLLENVDELFVEGDMVRMISIFGEEKILKAKVRSYSGSGGKIVIEILP